MIVWNILINIFKFFSNLSKTHGGVCKNLIFAYLFLNNFSKYYLKAQAQSCFFQIFLKHQSLLLSFLHQFWIFKVMSFELLVFIILIFFILMLMIILLIILRHIIYIYNIYFFPLGFWGFGVLGWMISIKTFYLKSKVKR